MKATSGIATLLFLLAAALVATASAQTKGPTQAQLTDASSNAIDWLHSNHDYGGQRFVNLKQIDRTNVHRLVPVCLFQAGDIRPFYTTPIVYRGTMYITTAYSTIALDAATCRLRWRHDWKPKAPENWPSHRGAAVKDGKLVRGTLDGYLLALDMESGQVLWEQAAADGSKGEGFTMPPLIYEDLVLIGPSGNESAVKGWVGAFRLDTGRPVWRFNVFPASEEPGSETWSATKAVTGGGAVWTPFSLDTTEGLVYVATGNPSPDYYGDVREGDNLYTNSMVALDARTGKLVWYHQATPHDTHDWDLTQASPVFTADIAGRSHKLVVVTGKDGLVRVLDRETRKLMYEVPVSRRENATVPVTVEGVHVCPASLGGVQWNGPAYSPSSSMLYVAAVDWCGTIKKSEELRREAGKLYMGGTIVLDPAGTGTLTAIDVSSGHTRWKYQSAKPMVGAVTATSSDLVLTGELTGDFIALDGRDGKVLYRFNTGGPIGGGVITYQVEGKQYVATTSGATTAFLWRTPPASSTIVVFALPTTPN
jgi:PQQ-dependent dehydrogenase (methanol/ethanol family)